MALASDKYHFSKMNRIATLQKLVRASDSQGGWTETVVNVGDIFISLEPQSAYSRFQADQILDPGSYKAFTRYRDDVTTDYRLYYEGRTFLIKEVIDVQENRQFLELKLTEKKG